MKFQGIPPLWNFIYKRVVIIYIYIIINLNLLYWWKCIFDCVCIGHLVWISTSCCYTMTKYTRLALVRGIGPVSQHKLCASHTRFQWTVWYFPTNIVIHAAQSHAQQLAILWSQLKQVIHSNSNIKIHKSSCNLKWISETRSHHSLQQTP